LGKAAVERRAEDLTPEEFEDLTPEKSAGGGATDKGAVVGARDDLEHEIYQQRWILGHAWLLSLACS
jgi:hypothetical protein